MSSKFHQENEIIKMIYQDKGILSIHNFVKYLNKKQMKEGVYLGSFLISNIYSEIIQEYENLNRGLNREEYYYICLTIFSTLTIVCYLCFKIINSYKNLPCGVNKEAKQLELLETLFMSLLIRF